jgi:hypothetical protein
MSYQKNQKLFPDDGYLFQKLIGIDQNINKIQEGKKG